MEMLAKAGAMEYRTVELLKQVGLSPSILRFDPDEYCCEFRTPEESVVFDYGTLTGDRPHYVYPQHDSSPVFDALVDVDGDIRFGMEVTGLTREQDGITLSVRDEAGGAECDPLPSCRRLRRRPRRDRRCAAATARSSSNRCRSDGWLFLARHLRWSRTRSMQLIRVDSPGRCAASRR